jgi:tetratricopeptide (TPR) repeat protein
MPDWRRWNNYGIALFDQRQFPNSIDAFEEVINLATDYKAFAYTNKALATIELGGWVEAERLIATALEIDKNNMRALYQRGRIHRARSRLDKAEEDYKKVLESYPRDRLTLQQLGELAKIKSDVVPKSERVTQLNIAKGYYEQVLAIDPEDMSAHYNMMIIYQKLGRREDARREAKIFQDLKEDTQVTPLAGAFLAKNPAIGLESLPYHTHELRPFQPNLEKKNYKSNFLTSATP